MRQDDALLGQWPTAAATVRLPEEPNVSAAGNFVLNHLTQKRSGLGHPVAKMTTPAGITVPSVNSVADSLTRALPSAVAKIRRVHLIFGIVSLKEVTCDV